MTLFGIRMLPHRATKFSNRRRILAYIHFRRPQKTPWFRAPRKLSGKLWILQIRQLSRKLQTLLILLVAFLLVVALSDSQKFTRKLTKSFGFQFSLIFISASYPRYQGYWNSVALTGKYQQTFLTHAIPLMDSKKQQWRWSFYSPNRNSEAHNSHHKSQMDAGKQ